MMVIPLQFAATDKVKVIMTDISFRNAKDVMARLDERFQVVR